ncbi:MAG: class I SAM-dependent RNA methyltransferase [Spirochaetaceae bacterium]|jgi:putative N6-adenine-specific DNA methylase|nr:class I SAM-dependent RNA methyltransferase [Spirochaetaceae bacterium]
MKNEETAIALCAVGAEKVVSNELKHLGITVLDTSFGRVRFFASIENLYRALFCLRVADRVLIEAARYPAQDFDLMFDNAGNVEWEKYIPGGMGVVVSKTRTNRSKLDDERTIQAMIHKAVADRLCKHYGVERLPEDGKIADIRVYIEKDMVSIMLDISGDPLFKRGYRIEGGVAPLRETTAAAILLLSGWRRKFPLYDPFCGSGTIAIEAAMFAWDMAPGVGRKFAIADLVIADDTIERTIRKELLARVDFSRRIRIGGSDSDPAAVEAARANMLRAEALAKGGNAVPATTSATAPAKTVTIKVSGARPVKKPVVARFPHQPAFRLLPMENTSAPEDEGEGFIVTNPPYGNRMGNTSEAEAVYQRMAHLRSRFPAWKLAVITDHTGFESHFGRKADAVRQITNGATQTYLYVFNNDSSIGASRKPAAPDPFSAQDDRAGRFERTGQTEHTGQDAQSGRTEQTEQTGQGGPTGHTGQDEHD